MGVYFADTGIKFHVCQRFNASAPCLLNEPARARYLLGRDAQLIAHRFARFAFSAHSLSVLLYRSLCDFFRALARVKLGLGSSCRQPSVIWLAAWQDRRRNL